MPTDLKELLANEKSNFESTSTFMGHAVDLVQDLEKVYELGVNQITRAPGARPYLA